MKKCIATLWLSLVILLMGGCSSKGSDVLSTESSNSDVLSEPVSITIFGLPVTVPDTDPIIPELEKRLNIDLNLVSTGGDESQLVARLASGNIPDVFRVTTLSNLSAYYQDGVLLNLSDYMDKMPNVQNLFTEQQLARVTFDGRISGILRRSEENYNSWYIRYDWLEKLGLSDPANFDELLETAAAMNKADFDGNGKDDTYAISGTYGSAASTFGRGAFDGFWTAYGVTDPETIMIKDNKAVMACTLPEFRLAVEEIRRFVEAGVVDPEIISNTTDVLLEKMSTGKAGICYGGWANYSKPTQVKALQAVSSDAEWGPMRVEIATDYGVSGASNSASGNDAVYAINADLVNEPEKLEAVLEFFNYVATDEADMLLSFGIENEHYTIDSSGTAVKLDKMDELDYGWAIQFLGRQDMQYCMTKFSDCAEVIKYSAEEIPIYNHYGQMVEQPEDVNVSDLESYVLEQVARFIYKDRNMDEWDDFISSLYSSYLLQDYIDAANETLSALGYIK